MRDATISTPNTSGTPGVKGEGSLSTSAFSTLDKLFSVAWPGAVYSTPITAHDQTLITASEVTVGVGMGFGSSPSTRPDASTSAERSLTSKGGGGGGRSNARPVAVISINPAGVRIQPIIDVNRLVVTATSTLGILLILRAVRRLRAKS